ncbi:MAG: exodeoxyribonuclease VII small subunit [Rhodospirillales bacterium]|jgi:exodeoxyribonuclease VII small subunit|nr:exodeoxyribonuclease VII small subunit [Rhodospirillales bacterium]
MGEKTTSADVANLSFEDALTELEGIVRRLEDGTGKLDEAIDAYERGAILKRHCETKLQEARARVEKIVLDTDGAASVAPTDFDRGTD